MKRITILFLFITGSIFGQTYYLNVWSNGSVSSIPVSDIKKLTFSDITDVSGEESSNEEALINTFELFQNYPNPFNPTTTIEYQTKNSGHVAIQIFNITGELVKTLLDTEQSVGKYSVQWDGKNNNGSIVASGIYIYSVRSGNSVLSKKMILLK